MSSTATSPVRSIPVPLETERGTYGMRCTILTEAFLFIALFASYFMLGSNKERWRIEELPKLHYALPMLAVLILSSLVLHWGEKQVERRTLCSRPDRADAHHFDWTGFLTLSGF